MVFNSRRISSMCFNCKEIEINKQNARQNVELYVYMYVCCSTMNEKPIRIE
jgi:hypothetical protein